ncbi:MAG: purine-nucleoside phosphorylase [Fusobacteriaceae bacterium]
MENYLEKLKEATQYIKSKTDYQPEIGMILGSGLGSIADTIEEAVVIPYHEIPHFPQSNVSGHAGNLVIGKLEGKVVFALQGRVHYYEGHSMLYITFPVRVMAMLGIKKMIVTNAAGGANETYIPGTLMVIKDHINLMGNSPLIGKNFSEFGTRFPDMTYAYSKKFREMALRLGKSLTTDIREGVYAGFTGPTYETPAEVKFARIIGADAVGMSTVPEVIVANHAGIETLGISCITNMAAGILDQKLDHSEVMDIANKVHNDFVNLVRNCIKEM